MQSLRVLLPALWAGVLLSVAGIAAPSAFAALPPGDAVKVVARVFRVDAYLGLVLPLAVVMVERRFARGLNATVLLALGALFCTVAGYFAVQPMLAAARDGQGVLGFGQLHAVSVAFFSLKTLLVLALAWRAAARAPALRPSSS